MQYGLENWKQVGFVINILDQKLLLSLQRNIVFNSENKITNQHSFVIIAS